MDESLKNKIHNEIHKYLNILNEAFEEGYESGKPKRYQDVEGFPLFGIPDMNQYENRWQEEYLECETRVLINKIINILFEFHKCDVKCDVKWIDNDIEWATGQLLRNYEQEIRYPIEFFVQKDGINYAYRYSAFYNWMKKPNENILNECEITGVHPIDKIIRIVWNTEIMAQKNVTHAGNSLHRNPFFETITAKDFFEDYFSDEEYEFTVAQISDAVKSARDYMTYFTIKSLKNSNLALFKENDISFLSVTQLRNISYCLVDEYGFALNTVNNGSIQVNDAERINTKFTDGRCSALYGKSKFAKSFLTSEYLFNCFKNGLSIDYTPIVCGYFKSVEQLCSVIYKNAIIQEDEELYINARKRYKNENKDEYYSIVKLFAGYPYVSGNKENEQYFGSDTYMTMQKYFWFFNYNHRKLFDISSDESWDYIFKCLRNYGKFDRNGFLHKDNIDSYGVASRIRNNTILIMYWLLGSLKLTENIEKDLLLLGGMDDTFDKLFRQLARRHNIKYLIKFSGKEEKKALKLKNNHHFNYDNYGQILDERVEFIVVQEFSDKNRDLINNPPKDAEIITIDKKHLPEYIKCYSLNGIELIFPET